VRHGRPVHANVVVIAEVEEFLPCGLGAVVSNDRVGYAEAIDDVGEERYDFLRVDVHDGSRLDPFRELIDRYDEICEAPRRLSERTHHVEVPHSEGPCDGDSFECLRREVSLSSVELTPLAVAHGVFGVHHNCGPVEPLLESFPDESPRTGVMPARASVDFTK
jgi:hypothetical protein